MCLACNKIYTRLACNKTYLRTGCKDTAPQICGVWMACTSRLAGEDRLNRLERILVQGIYLHAHGV